MSVGRRGETGVTGATGERGPTGDRGGEGTQGERGLNARLPAKLGGWIVIAVLAGTCALFLIPYGAANKIRDTQLQACEAAKIDRGLQADSWRAAFSARSATANNPETNPAERKVAKEAAQVYADTADRLEARSDERYVCADQYPKPSLLPF